MSRGLKRICQGVSLIMEINLDCKQEVKWSNSSLQLTGEGQCTWSKDWMQEMINIWFWIWLREERIQLWVSNCIARRHFESRCYYKKIIHLRWMNSYVSIARRYFKSRCCCKKIIHLWWMNSYVIANKSDIIISTCVHALLYNVVVEYLVFKREDRKSGL